MVVPIDAVADVKTEIMLAHESQLFEWLPYNAGTLARVLPMLVRAAAVDALDRSSEPRADSKVSSRACELFLAHVLSAAQHSAPAIGLGEDVRLSSPSIAGAALVVDGAVVHLSAFASA